MCCCLLQVRTEINKEMEAVSKTSDPLKILASADTMKVLGVQRPLLQVRTHTHWTQTHTGHKHTLDTHTHWTQTHTGHTHWTQTHTGHKHTLYTNLVYQRSLSLVRKYFSLISV